MLLLRSVLSRARAAAGRSSCRTHTQGLRPLRTAAVPLQAAGPPASYAWRKTKAEYESDAAAATDAATRGDFWLDVAREEIDWVSEPTQAIDASNPPFYKWFPDGKLNVCYNALDRHVLAGRGDNHAIIYESTVGGESKSYTYKELLELVSRCGRAPLPPRCCPPACPSCVCV